MLSKLKRFQQNADVIDNNAIQPINPAISNNLSQKHYSQVFLGIRKQSRYSSGASRCALGESACGILKKYLFEAIPLSTLFLFYFFVFTYNFFVDYSFDRKLSHSFVQRFSEVRFSRRQFPSDTKSPRAATNENHQTLLLHQLLVIIVVIPSFCRQWQNDFLFAVVEVMLAISAM